jgi:hypothetical protein
MVTLQSASKEWTVTKKLRPQDGESIIPLISNNTDWFTANYNALPTDRWINGYITELNCYSDINSLTETAMPDYLIGESKTSALSKTLNLEWKSDRYQLDLYLTTEYPVTALAQWSLQGSISLINPAGYPYRTYRLKDLLTNNLAFSLGQNATLGYAIKNVGKGVIQSMDTVVITGSWKQELVLLQPDWQPLVVQGTISQVTQYTDTNPTNVTTTKKQLVAARGNRVSGFVTNQSTSTSFLLKYDSTISTTIYDAVVAPNATFQLPQAFIGEVWGMTSAGSVVARTSETWRAS